MIMRRVTRQMARQMTSQMARRQDKSATQPWRVVCRRAAALAVAAAFGLAILPPAQAQFWSPFGGPSYSRRPPAAIPQQQQQQPFNPFGGFFAPPAPEHKEAPVDYSHAPAPPSHKTDTAPTTPIVVMGDAMADWLAYGLEDAYSEQQEIAILRRHRTTSGLIRYDPRRDVDWAQTARDIIAADKPKVIVMMIGSNDHQAIRERPPTPAPRAPNGTGKSAQVATAPEAAPPTEDLPNPGDAEQPSLPDSGRNAGTNPAGPFEFHTDQWEAAYIKRIDATIAAMKSANVPVVWVGLPAQRTTRATSDASYLNELYRSRAEKAGIVFVDVWDGFVDEQGRYSPQGPDFEGQTRRLRSGDGVYFTKYGARKLAHYAEREIDRLLANRSVLVSLPVEPALQGARPGGASARPLAGPVIPLTAAAVPSATEELLGGARPAARPAAAPDPLATRVLTRGEPLGAPAGRADDFSWPRGSLATVSTTAEPEPQPSAGTGAARAGAQPATATAPSPKANGTAPGTPAKPAVAAAAAQRPDADSQPGDDSKSKPKKPAAPRPPAPVGPFSIVPNVMFR
jgi:hypothetical protein